MLELPAARIDGPTHDHFGVLVPRERQDEWNALRQHNKYVKSGQLYIKAGPPRKPRTTGHRSQNSHIHGHAQQIGEYLGEYKEDVVAEAKRRAVTLGYPVRLNSFGHNVPESETNISTREAALLIEELHKIASFANIKLKEYDE